MTATMDSPVAGGTVAGIDWLDERRAAARAAVAAGRMPSRRDEHWRFTELRGIDLAAYEASESSPVSPDAFDVGELPAGVVWAPLSSAARDHSELVQKHFGSLVPVTDSVNDHFANHQLATMTDGVFLYVPRGVAVELPLSATVLHDRDGDLVNWRALIVLEESASATFIEHYASREGVDAGLSNAVVEMIVGAGAQLTYVTTQELGGNVDHFATHRVRAERDAVVEWAAVGLGARRGKSRMEAYLAGPGSNVRLTGAYFLDGRQELDYDTLQVHEAPNAHSDLAFKGVLADRSHSVWRGMIEVAEGAQGTDAYQENRNLVLSQKAKADSIPGLQIEANEVRCTHGATIGKVDPEQLFYLMARGLSRTEATRLIVQGFYLPVLDRIPLEGVRDSIRDALWARLDSASA